MSAELSSHASSRKRPRTSCSSRYSPVAERTAPGGRSPSSCQAREPSSNQLRTPGSSVALIFWILLGLRDLHLEQNQPDPLPHRVVGPSDCGAVIRCEEDLERWRELEEHAVEKPGRDPIPASRLLHQRLRDPTPLVRLHRRHE